MFYINKIMHTCMIAHTFAQTNYNHAWCMRVYKNNMFVYEVVRDHILTFNQISSTIWTHIEPINIYIYSHLYSRIHTCMHVLTESYVQSYRHLITEMTMRMPTYFLTWVNIYICTNHPGLHPWLEACIRKSTYNIHYCRQLHIV